MRRGPRPAAAPTAPGHQMAAGPRRAALLLQPLTGAKLSCRPVINHICGSCFERQIHTDAVLREFFTAELVACLELRHLCTCSKTLLLREGKNTLPLQEKHMQHQTKTFSYSYG